MTWRCRRLLDEAQHHPCQACGGVDGVVAAHSNSGRHGKGLGIKAHDAFVAFLCCKCHWWVDQSRATGGDRKAVWHAAFLRSIPLFWKHLDDEAKAMVQAEMVHHD